MKNCKECGNEFGPKNPKGIFCSVTCRQKDYRKRINEIVKSGRAAKVETVVPESKVAAPVKRLNAVAEKFDFGNDPWLMIEKYTLYPANQRPSKIPERIEWDRKKAEYDQEIRKAWNLHKSKTQ